MYLNNNRSSTANDESNNNKGNNNTLTTTTAILELLGQTNVNTASTITETIRTWLQQQHHQQQQCYKCLTFQPSRLWHPRGRWRRPMRTAWRDWCFRVRTKFRPNFLCPKHCEGLWLPTDELNGWKRKQDEKNDLKMILKALLPRATFLSLTWNFTAQSTYFRSS